MVTPEQTFGQALGHHRAGRLETAERLYREVLAAVPGHCDALVNLGAIAAARSRFDEAAALSQRALENNPQCLNALVNLAAARYAQGDADGAAEALERAVGLAPQDLPLLLNLAGLRRAQGRAAEARALLERAHERAPSDPEPLVQLALEALAGGRLEEAERHLRAALAREPRHAEAQFNLARLREQAGDAQGAVEHYRRALQANTRHPGALNNFGLLLDRLGKKAEAAMLLRRAVAAEPARAEFHYNLGSVLADQDEFDGATIALGEALRLNPGYREARLRLANLYTATGAYEAAERCYRSVLAQEPSHAVAHANLGVLHEYRGAMAEAEAEFRQAIALDPGYAAAHFNLALLLLREERFAEGWREYEWRWQVIDSLPPRAPLPLWDGSPLDGRGLLVLGEQGPGDMVMFAQCLPEVLEQTNRVVLTAEPRLVDLLARSFPRVEIRPADYREVPDVPEGCEVALAIGSLLGLFRRRPTDFAHTHIPYLVPDPEAVARWRERFAALGPGPKIGLSWAGGASPSERRFRGLDSADLEPLLELPECRFVNLQYGKRRGDGTVLAERTGIPIADWADADPVSRFDDHVAQIACLDAIVSVANTVIHAAGALGTPALVLTPATPSWRWGLRRSHCLWYPAVELLRQGAGEPWRAVAERAAARLAHRLARREGDEAAEARAPMGPADFAA